MVKLDLSAQTKSLLNTLILIVAVYTAADYVWVSVYHQKPILEMVEPFMGFLAAFLVGAAVASHFRHHPVL